MEKMTHWGYVSEALDVARINIALAMGLPKALCAMTVLQVLSCGSRRLSGGEESLQGGAELAHRGHSFRRRQSVVPTDLRLAHFLH